MNNAGWLHEKVAIVATIDPIDANNADSATDIIDMSLYSEVMFIIQLGVLDASATFDFGVYEDEAASMSGETVMTGKSLTQVTGTGDALQHIISVKAEELTAGCRYIRGIQANSAHSQLVAVVALAVPKYKPATDVDLSSVTQIKA